MLSTNGGLVGTSAQSIPNGVWSPMSFMVQEFGGMNPIPGSPIPGFVVEEDGLYLVIVGYNWAPHAVGMRAVRLLKNGAPCFTFTARRAGDTGNVAGSHSALVPALVGDTLGADAYQNSGGDLVLGASDVRHAMCSLHAVKVAA